MNVIKLLAPDFLPGKIMVTIKSLIDTIWLLTSNPSVESWKFAGLVVRFKPKFTMVKTRNLKVLYDLVCEAKRRRLRGDIVECGVWNGGSAAIMAVAALDDSIAGSRWADRTLWLFDSFQGLPPPGEKDGELEKRDYFQGLNQGNVDLVKEVLRKVGFQADKVKIVPGWFDETLQTAPIKDIALLHIDADWYDSVKIVLTTFFDRVVPGGFIVLDDYGYWQGCSQALSDFFKERGFCDVAVTTIGRQGAYFCKPYDNPPAKAQAN